MSNPYTQIAKSIKGGMKDMAKKAVSGLSAELGTITATGLMLDSFKDELPDYMLADWLVRLHLPDDILDDVHLDLKSGLLPGDRVLVIPVYGGRNVVVISK